MVKLCHINRSGPVFFRHSVYQKCKCQQPQKSEHCTVDFIKSNN